MPATARTVLITGASSGIGRATALRLDRLGWRVFAGVRKSEDADALRREASERLRPLFLDVTKPDHIAAAARTIEADVGEAGDERGASLADLADDAGDGRRAGLDALVNNAGIALGAPLEFLPVDEFRRQLEVNVVGQLAVTQALLESIRRARGRIINVGSIAGRSALPLVGAYAASKHALEAMTDTLRMELRRWDIEVVIVEPGAVRTAIWERSVDAAERMMAAMPERVRELYGALIDGVIAQALESARTGIDAERVAEVVEDALTAERPRTRYLVGRDARVRAWLQKLPDRWRDAFIARRLAGIDDPVDEPDAG